MQLTGKISSLIGPGPQIVKLYIIRRSAIWEGNQARLVKLRAYKILYLCLKSQPINNEQLFRKPNKIRPSTANFLNVVTALFRRSSWNY